MSRDLITIAQFKYFVEAAALGSLSKVTAVRDIDQPTLSRAIKRLEAALGCPVFHRNGRGVSLTPRGAELFDFASDFLRQLDSLEERINMDRLNPEGTVSFAVVHSLTEQIVPRIIVEFKSECPNISLHFYGSDSRTIRSNILDGTVDLGVFYGSVGDGELHVDHVISERMYISGSLSSATRFNLGQVFPSKAISGLPLAVPGIHHGLRKRIEALASREGLALNVRYEADLLHTLRALIRIENCFTILPYSATRDLRQDPAIYCVPIVAPELVVDLSLAYAKGRPASATVRRFSAFLKLKLSDYTRGLQLEDGLPTAD